MNPLSQMFLEIISFYAKLLPYCVKQVFSKRFSCRTINGLKIKSDLPVNTLYLGERHFLVSLQTLFFRSVTLDSFIEQYSLVDTMRGIKAIDNKQPRLLDS